ncbi:MAG: GNAT family N-acetyltransferase [Lewinellaceae bacterium]|nr:GNAT family N-acetyltransferase [Saprospiraceae bacterium]MCB9337517.1 GNAT family N-acetyltransferase [Lewinellaceae bacterium]
MDSNAKHIETLIVPRHELDGALWNSFIAQSPQGANYAMTWYLDAVWPTWQGILVFYKGKLQAVMPVRASSKFGISYCLQPWLCQYLGIFFASMELKNEKAWALKKRLVTAVADTIPQNLKKVVLNFAPEFDYPLPFHWAGYELRTRYTYWLDHNPDKQLLFGNLNERTRTYINKAGRSGLTASNTGDVAGIIQLSREQEAYPLDYNVLGKLWAALQTNNAGRAIEVRDKEGRLHCGLLYHVSGQKQIHLFSALDPATKHLGGMSLAIWHSIEQAVDDIRIHDFEGSMLEPVEKFFRGFNTYPVPYLQIRKNTFPKPLRWMVED